LSLGEELKILGGDRSGRCEGEESEKSEGNGGEEHVFGLFLGGEVGGSGVAREGKLLKSEEG